MVSPHRLVVFLLSLLLLLVPGSASADDRRVPDGAAPAPGSGAIDVTGFVRVIDGDTVEVLIDGKRVGIGLVGIQSPVGNTDCGRQATAQLRSLVKGGVHLEEDPTIAFDERGRRMYRITARDGRSVQEEMLKSGLSQADRKSVGHARAAGRPGNVVVEPRLAAAEDEGRGSNRGCVWNRQSQAENDAVTFAKTDTAVDTLAIPPSVPRPKVVAAAPAAATTLPAGFTQEVVASGLTEPTNFAFLPDGRILITEKSGRVKIYKDGAILPTPFLDIRSQVNDYWDHGLLGIAIDPNFATNGYVYLLHTYENNGTGGGYYEPKTSRLSRYTASGDTADPNSRQIILGTVVGSTCNDYPDGADCLPSESPSHSIGSVKFASDGTMFVTVGDGAQFNYVDPNALRTQNLNLMSGKMLHITSDGKGISTNPFWNGDATANRSKVWAYGLRNSYRFNLQPGTNIPFLGDVGWSSWEEINIVPAGANLGWPCYEGTFQQAGYAGYPVCQSLYSLGTSAVQAPLVAWDHSGGSAAATGGVFYSGTGFPAQYRDAYFYVDYAQNWMAYLKIDSNYNLVGNPTNFATGLDGPVAVDMGPDQKLYYMSINNGELRRIRSTAQNTPPIANMTATPTNGLAPLAVQFSSAGSSDPDGDSLQFSWNFGDGSPSVNQADTTHTYTTNGVYTAILTVTDARNGVNTAETKITVGNRAPVPTISTPSTSLKFKVGDTITFAGSATDLDEGNLPSSALSWEIKLHHCPGGVCHIHPFTSTTGPGGSFPVPDHGDESYFEVVLTATDGGGLSAKSSVVINPETAQITLATVPSGLTVVYDGVSAPAPITRTTIVNSTHTIQVSSPQGAATFNGWSDGGAQQHNVTMGTSDATYTASFDILPLVTFDDLPGQDLALNGQYPTSIIDWGTGQWWHSAPWNKFTTKSVTYNGQGINSATFTFVTPRRLTKIDAYNGGAAASTVTLSCAGQTTKTVSVAADQLLTIDTGWTSTCSAVTVGSSRGWDVNFDNLVHDSGGGPPPPDTTPPTVSSRSPVDAATNVVVGTTLTATFSEDVQGVSATTFQLKDASGTAVAGAVTYDAASKTATLTPSAALSGNATYTATLTGGASAIRDQANNPLVTVSWSFTTAAAPPPPTCPCSIWPSSATPAVAAQADPTAVEVGIKFRSDVAGYVTGIRFYKGTGNTGTHVGSLWNSTGTRLANATFTNETATGWQQVSFATPVQIAANTTYVASYQAPNGRYSITANAFTTAGIDNAPLHALANGTDGTNGVYKYGPAGTFPDQSYQATNYWVDVVFSTTPPTPDTTPPTVSSRSPADAATGVATNTTVTATFSEDVQGVSGTTFQLKDAGGATVAAAVTYSSATRTATLTPSAALANSATYTATLTGGASAIRDQANNPLATGSWSFTTAAAPPPPTCPCSIWPSSATPAVAAQADPTAVEVGVRFRSDAAGYVTGVRFYKGTGNTGTHVGSLWSNTGTRLANATFSGETATGWQQVSFATPVQIAANTTYVASYHAPVGRYSVTANAFTTAGIDNGPLHALATGTDGPNGVYKYGPAGTFPDQTYQATNYWVDVVFSTTPPTPDTTPPTVSSRSPADAATGVSTTGAVTATFSEDVQGVSGTTFQLKDAGGATVAAAVTYSSATRTATLTPSAALGANTAYTATLTGGATAIRDLANNPLATGSWSFTTGAVSTAQTVTFDDATGQDRMLNGQYPTNVINWGTNRWWLSGSYGQFTTKSISFEAANVTSRTFTFVTARRLVRIDAYNGGTAATTITLACTGQTTKSQVIQPGQVGTIDTGWSGTCTTITVGSSNGWDTNFDNVVHDAGP